MVFAEALGIHWQELKRTTPPSRKSGAKQCQPSVRISPRCPPATFSDTKYGARTKPIALAGLLAKHVERLVTTKFKSHVASRPNFVKSGQSTMPFGGPLALLWADKNCRGFDLTFRTQKNRKTFVLLSSCRQR